MSEDNRQVVEPKTNTDIYIMIKIVSVMMCFIIFAIFFYAKKFVFISDYDLIAVRGIFRNPSEINEEFRKIANAGAFWTYFNRGLAFFFLLGGIIHIITSVNRSISQKVRAFAETILSIILTVSLPLYFLIACIVSKSTVKFSGMVVLMIIFFVMEVLFTVYFSRRYIKDNKTFSTSSNKVISILAGILFIIVPLLPLGLGVKAIGLANDYYKKNPYEIFDRSGIITPDEVGNYMNKASVLENDVYMCSANTILKIDGQGNVSEVFKPDGYVGCMQVYDGKIYYALTEFRRDIYCYDLASGENTLIFSENDISNYNIRLFYIKEGKLYFAIFNNELYCVDTNDIKSGPELVFRDMLDAEAFQYYNYYGISLDDLRGSNPNPYYSSPFSTYRMLPYKGQIFRKKYDSNDSYVTKNGDYYLQSWEKDEQGKYIKGNLKKIVDNMEQFTVYDDTLYYTNYEDDNCLLYRADLNGENAEIIATFDRYSYSLAITEDHIYVCFVDDIAVVDR